MIGFKSNCGYFQTSKWWYSHFYWVPALKILEGIKYWSPSSKSSHRIESKPLNNSWPHLVLLYFLTSHTLAMLAIFIPETGSWHLLFPLAGVLFLMDFSWLVLPYCSGLSSIHFFKEFSLTTLSKVASIPSNHSISPCFTFPPQCLLISEMCYPFINFAHWKVSSTMAGILSFWSTTLSPVLRTMFGLE